MPSAEVRRENFQGETDDKLLLYNDLRSFIVPAVSRGTVTVDARGVSRETRSTASVGVVRSIFAAGHSHPSLHIPVARVIAIANQKGGVGKTTTAVNLAASLAVAEQRTLLIDGDPQGNATSGIGLLRDDVTQTTYDVLIGESTIAAARHRRVQFATLDVLPATADLAGAEVELVERDAREAMMRNAVALVRDDYDYILIDCPPSLGLITVNMLAAADALLIPVQCEYYALEGLSQLLNTVHLVQRSVNPELGIDGVLLTMYDARLNLSRQVATDAREYFGPKVFESVIPRNVRLAEAPSFGKPIILYDLASVGAQAYMAVAKELIARHRKAPAEIHGFTRRVDS